MLIICTAECSVEVVPFQFLASRGSLGPHMLCMEFGIISSCESVHKQVDCCDALTHVVLAALHADHLHSWVLDGSCAVAVLGFKRLVRHPLALYGEHGQILALIFQQDLVAYCIVFRVCVQLDWQAKQNIILRGGTEPLSASVCGTAPILTAIQYLLHTPQKLCP